MKTAHSIVGLLTLSAISLAACGGSKQEPKIMTQEERLNQQIAMAEEQQDDQDQQLSEYDAAETNSEKESRFDEQSAEHELKRASLNAVDCPNTFEKAQLEGYRPGSATVSLIFENNGGVKDVSVSAPYSDTKVGQCIQRAYGSVHIEPFVGEEVPKSFEIELGEAKPIDAK